MIEFRRHLKPIKFNQSISKVWSTKKNKFKNWKPQNSKKQLASAVIVVIEKKKQRHQKGNSYNHHGQRLVTAQSAISHQ